MTGFDFIVVLGVRYLLVVLFFPFSALDKILGFKGAVGQASQATSSPALATLLVLIGLTVEICMPILILTGVADRLAAFIMAGYCMVTALLWKQFWSTGDFWRGPDSKGRGLFWDFLKNFSLAGGFLLITFGTMSATSFIEHPLSSTHPYAAHAAIQEPSP
ncbi:DoxX family protein [Lichenicoccus roseus]|uniref:DoxX family protein n=1 Tax=Lichenicoccus roseus TaxID=2683649 RepID=A0A5R9JA02_9PROT|nr:DoxX family protein [Lichenicoccus roseus]TLU74405.1 DoxX family protein [Lichenicoccus roseus]